MSQSNGQRLPGLVLWVYEGVFQHHVARQVAASRRASMCVCVCLCVRLRVSPGEPGSQSFLPCSPLRPRLLEPLLSREDYLRPEPTQARHIRLSLNKRKATHHGLKSGTIVYKP